MILASRNKGKAGEFERLLGRALDVRPLPSGVRLPEEKGRTFAENARLKAEAVFAALGGKEAVLADDSGLEVSALGGRPGVLSARFAGESATDEENVRRLLEELGGRTDREARFVCALCLLVPDERAAGKGAYRSIEVQGSSDGAVTTTARGTGGFGYDPVFRPVGWAVTLAEVDPGRKDSVSHRGAAARALLDRLVGEEEAEDGT